MYTHIHSFIHQTFFEHLVYIQHCDRSQEGLYKMGWFLEGGEKALEKNNYKENDILVNETWDKIGT